MADPYEGMNPDFAAKVRALVAASGGRVTIKSGHRSTARQSALWNAALAKYGSVAKARKWVAPPGKSNHERGTAVDFGGDLKLVAKLAPRFGLHQALSNEPWHYEPIGSRGKKTATAPAATAAAVHSPDDGHNHAAESMGAPVVEQAKTWAYQLQNLGAILMGGDSDGGT